MKIYVSPSNQTDNVYAVGNTTEEEQCNRIAHYLISYLQSNGHTVAAAPRNQLNAKSIKDANAWGAELYVCVHTNAGGGRGCEVYVYNPTIGAALKWATPVYNNMSAITPSTDRGIKNGSSFNEIKNSNAPCVYVECEFHDNAETATWIINNVQAIGKAIAKGICEGCGAVFFDPDAVAPEPTPDPTPTPAPDPEPTPEPDPEVHVKQLCGMKFNSDEDAKTFELLMYHLLNIDIKLEPITK